MAAIYDFEWTIEISLTTTLYPVDITELMMVSCAPVNETGWWPVPTESAYVGGFVPTGGTLYTVRFDAPMQGPESAVVGGFVPLSGTLYIVRFDAPMQGPESGAIGFNVLSATLVDVIVDADTPDELLEITCSIASDCTMTPV